MAYFEQPAPVSAAAGRALSEVPDSISRTTVERGQSGGDASGEVHQVLFDHQPQNREGTRHLDSALDLAARHRGDRIATTGIFVSLLALSRMSASG